jgi:acyl carrier protein
MALSQPVLDFLNESATRAGSAAPTETDDLFKLGALDSFSLVDLLTILEQEFGIKIPDSDVNPANFQTIQIIEQYINRRKGQNG